MMMIKKIAAAAALLAAVPAFASISYGGSGNGELALFVYDDVAKVSYAKDLGIFQNDFKAAADSFGFGASAAAEQGYSKSITITSDSFWNTFLASSTEANRKWSVIAYDGTGGITPNGVRIFTTAANTAANLTNLSKWTNAGFTAGSGSTQLGRLYDTLNNTGSHGTSGIPLDTAINGSSVNFETDEGFGYFGAPSSGPTFNNSTTFNSGNAIGASSSFYYLTRSSNVQTGFVSADLFANSHGNTTLTFSTSGGTPTLTISAVPEPGTYAMLLVGLVAVGFVARRRNTQA